MLGIWVPQKKGKTDKYKNYFTNIGYIALLFKYSNNTILESCYSHAQLF